MVLDVHIEADLGAIRNLIERLDEAGDRGLFASIVSAVEDAAAPLPRKAARSAIDILPSAGGLGERVANTEMPIVTRLMRARAGVLIPARPGAVKDPGAINRGRVRHPVYGRWPKNVLIQNVRPGWFTTPMVESREDFRTAIMDAIEEVIRGI